MNATWRGAPLFAFALVLAASGLAQDNGTATAQDNPGLKTRPKDSAPPAEQPEYRTVSSAPPVAPDALPEGKRFIIKLKDTLDTRNLDEGQHFDAELREDLVTAGGLTIPRGQAVKGHVATFEHGYTGARMMLAVDELETLNGWVPLVATVMGVPGDHSIKPTGEEGEFTRKGPDKKRVVTNAAIGAGVGAAAGAATGGGKGAAVGAATGAGLGSASSYIFKGADLKLEQGTNLELRLDRDLVVPTK